MVAVATNEPPCLMQRGFPLGCSPEGRFQRQKSTYPNARNVAPRYGTLRGLPALSYSQLSVHTKETSHAAGRLRQSWRWMSTREGGAAERSPSFLWVVSRASACSCNLSVFETLCLAGRESWCKIRCIENGNARRANGASNRGGERAVLRWASPRMDCTPFGASIAPDPLLSENDLVGGL